MQTTTHARAAAGVLNAAHPYTLDGWDAYEVWRTRVLLPRQQRGAVPLPAPRPAPLPRPGAVPQRTSVPRPIEPISWKTEVNVAVYAVALSAAVMLLIGTLDSER